MEMGQAHRKDEGEKWWWYCFPDEVEMGKRISHRY
jgi:hypothetical protein